LPPYAKLAALAAIGGMCSMTLSPSNATSNGSAPPDGYKPSSPRR
jgi:hypothetical protein